MLFYPRISLGSFLHHKSWKSSQKTLTVDVMLDSEKRKKDKKFVSFNLDFVAMLIIFYFIILVTIITTIFSLFQSNPYHSIDFLQLMFSFFETQSAFETCIQCFPTFYSHSNITNSYGPLISSKNKSICNIPFNLKSSMQYLLQLEELNAILPYIGRVKIKIWRFL